MRATVCPLFCFLAVYFFIRFLTQTRLRFPDPNEELLLSLLLTIVIYAILYGLYRLIRRLRFNPALWRIIFYLIILIVVLVTLSIPELRREITLEGEHPIVFSVLFLILCGYCRTRPARSTSSS